jgi:ring-1,2-phenylacetyl-CoA epoxidase subunit PaaC
VNEQEQQRLLEIADDELILGWRDSEWTGIAPMLEEDVAFSSIAQNEIGHARALYELVARERGTTADELAFDRSPDEYRCAQIVELRLLDWEKTIARHYLYEEADAIRLERLKQSDDPEIAGLAAKIDREEAYHRIHARMWFDRLRDQPRFTAAIQGLWLLALALVADDLRPQLAARTGLSTESGSEPQSRGTHTAELAELWEEMTVVRRSQPAGTKW